MGIRVGHIFQSLKRATKRRRQTPLFRFVRFQNKQTRHCVRKSYHERAKKRGGQGARAYASYRQRGSAS